PLGAARPVGQGEAVIGPCACYAEAGGRVDGPGRVAWADQLSPQLLAVAGIRLMMMGGDPEAFLTAAQQQHPGDFWLNFALASSLTEAKPAEAVGYYRAALAARPGTPVVYNNLAVALQAQGQLAEAIVAYRKAAEFNPRDAEAHYNLGQALA